MTPPTTRPPAPPPVLAPLVEAGCSGGFPFALFDHGVDLLLQLGRMRQARADYEDVVAEQEQNDADDEQAELARRFCLLEEFENPIHDDASAPAATTSLGSAAVPA